MAFPIVYLFVAALLFDIPGHYLVRIILAPSFYIASILAVTAGYALWEVYHWGWYAFVVANVFMIYINALYLNDFGGTSHKAVAFSASIFFLVLMMYRVAREIRVPYFFPKIRWWESNPRYKLSVPVRILRDGKDPVDGQILDLSMGGCFVKLRQDVDLYEQVALDFTAFAFRVQCSGVAVWRTHSTVTHPKGMGIKFSPLSKVQKRPLRQITIRLKKIAILYRKSRYLLNEEEFLHKLEKIETATSSNTRFRLVRGGKFGVRAEVASAAATGTSGGQPTGNGDDRS